MCPSLTSGTCSVHYQLDLPLAYKQHMAIRCSTAWCDMDDMFVGGQEKVVEQPFHLGVGGGGLFRRHSCAPSSAIQTLRTPLDVNEVVGWFRGRQDLLHEAFVAHLVHWAKDVTDHNCNMWDYLCFVGDRLSMAGEGRAPHRLRRGRSGRDP